VPLFLHHLEGGDRGLTARRGRGDARRHERAEPERAVAVERRVAVLVLQAALVLVPAETELERSFIPRTIPEIRDRLTRPVLLREVVAAPEERPVLAGEVRERTRCGLQIFRVARDAMRSRERERRFAREVHDLRIDRLLVRAIIEVHQLAVRALL